MDRSKSFNCETIHGSWNMHEIRFVSHNISCFCFACIDRIPNGKCKNELHVPTWTLKRIKLTNSVEVRNMMIDLDEEIDNSTSGEWIAYGVYVGDNVAVIIDSETNEQFWLLLVDKVVHNVEESFKD